MMNDLEKTLEKLKIKKEDTRSYGERICKVDFTKFSDLSDKGKLILVTSLTPTPFGEGKTTTLIGLVEGLNKLNKNAIGTMREPSLGPVFGLKGGASGGGLLKVEPQEEIDLHFTGDLHAITSANNLIAAAIDNHIHQGNALNINLEKIYFERCLDMNDRALREIEIALSNNGMPRRESFTITAASEIMAIFCLSKDYFDLRRRIDNIVFAKDKFNKDLCVKSLNITGSVVALLSLAFKPNLVLTGAKAPVLIHGGPFANIAHGCNSIVATNLGLKLCDYVVTEAGFGADLGAEKFFNIKSQVANLGVSLCVVVVTIKALIHHGDGELAKGLSNLDHHLEHLKKYNVPLLVCLNKYIGEKEEDIIVISEHLKEKNIEFTMHSGYENGADGCIEFSKKVIELTKENIKPLYLYKKEGLLRENIRSIVRKCYQAEQVKFTENALFKIKELQDKKGYVCIAKTPLSITDDPKKKNVKNFVITIRDVKYEGGAEFFVCYTGKIFLMPGLGKKNRYEKIDFKENKIKF